MTAPDASTPATPPPHPTHAPHPTPSPSPGPAPTPPATAPGTSPSPGTLTAQWVFPEPAPPAALAGWGLTFSVIALAASLFVGWALPLGMVGIVIAIIALRRPAESRAVAVWALCLGAVSVLYSAGWLLWAAGRASIVG